MKGSNPDGGYDDDIGRAKKESAQTDPNSEYGRWTRELGAIASQAD